MALDPNVQQAVLQGDLPGVINHGSYHVPFFGTGRASYAAYQQGAYLRAGSNAVLFGVEVLTFS